MNAVSDEQMKPAGVSAAPVAQGEWRVEAVRVWAAMPRKGFFLALAAAWALVFQFLGNATFGHIDSASLFVWLHGVYTAPHQNDDHGLLMPLVIAGLLWWKREALLAVHKEVWWPGLLILAVATAMHVVGYVIQQPRLSSVALFLGLYGLTGLAWGRAWLRESFFPFFLFAFCVPVGSLAENITFPMRLVVTEVSVALAQGLGISVVQDGSRIFDEARTFQYDVAPACSGIRSLMALLALGTIYGWMTFQAWWRRGLLIAVALPLAVIGNVARVTAVIITGHFAGQKAGETLHDYAGFVTFAVAMACVLWLGRVLREEATADSGGAARSSPPPQTLARP